MEREEIKQTTRFDQTMTVEIDMLAEICVIVSIQVRTGQ